MWCVNARSKVVENWEVCTIVLHHKAFPSIYKRMKYLSVPAIYDLNIKAFSYAVPEEELISYQR